jgi:hypothetical protein
MHGSSIRPSTSLPVTLITFFLSTKASPGESHNSRCIFNYLGEFLEKYVDTIISFSAIYCMFA